MVHLFMPSLHHTLQNNTILVFLYTQIQNRFFHNLNTLICMFPRTTQNGFLTISQNPISHLSHHPALCYENLY